MYCGAANATLASICEARKRHWSGRKGLASALQDGQECTARAVQDIEQLMPTPMQPPGVRSARRSAVPRSDSSGVLREGAEPAFVDAPASVATSAEHHARRHATAAGEMTGYGGFRPPREPTVRVPTALTSAQIIDPLNSTPPDRYRVRQDAQGSLLTCVEAPTVTVRIKFGATVTAAGARNAAAGSIFLDGAAQGEPFLDTKREVYNLDHHEGCVRSFTLATCEQTMVLIRTGLDLRKRDWTVQANDPDLDTVLAIWVLLNHVRLTDENTEPRARIMPLIRLQGAIDAHGLELQDVCALPPALLSEAQSWIERLRERELAIKAQGRWEQCDLLEYTADRLRAIDHLVYPPTHFDDVAEVEEIARAEIAEESVVIVCRSRAGIYEVQSQLRRVHGKRLGIIALQKSASAYSLRQVDPYLPMNLDPVYTQLNLVDPAAGGQRAANRWGGSAEIGGSPRSSGTKLSPQQIVEVCQQAFGTPTLMQRVVRVSHAALQSAALVLTAVAAVFAVQQSPMTLPAGVPTSPGLQFPILLGLIACVVLYIEGRRSPGVFGLRRPSGVDWLSLVPLAGISALAGGVWIPAVGITAASDFLVSGWPPLAAVLMLPLATEVVFRGLIHGGLVRTFAIQQCGGPWFVSWPVIVSAVLFALWSALLELPPASLTQTLLGNSNASGPLLGALILGVATGMIRERSESLLPPILLHWLCAAAVIFTHAA
jgi:membrane protease YdiL (CAAX protease family)